MRAVRRRRSARTAVPATPPRPSSATKAPVSPVSACDRAGKCRAYTAAATAKTSPTSRNPRRPIPSPRRHCPTYLPGHCPIHLPFLAPRPRKPRSGTLRGTTGSRCRGPRRTGRFHSVVSIPALPCHRRPHTPPTASSHRLLPCHRLLIQIRPALPSTLRRRRRRRCP